MNTSTIYTDPFSFQDHSYLLAVHPTPASQEGAGNTNDFQYKQLICTCDSRCEGELAWCKEEERKSEICPKLSQYARFLPALGGSKKRTINWIPGLCIDEAKSRDGTVYHSMDRTDENPFIRGGSGENRQRIDLTQLKDCIDYDSPFINQPGLDCGDGEVNCGDFFFWCNGGRYPEECPVLGAGVLKDDPRVCGDNHSGETNHV